MPFKGSVLYPCHTGRISSVKQRELSRDVPLRQRCGTDLHRPQTEHSVDVFRYVAGTDGSKNKNSESSAFAIELPLKIFNHDSFIILMLKGVEIDTK